MKKHKIEILIFLLAVVVYANALFNSFVWDDRYLIVENTLAKSWRNVPAFFTTHLFEGSEQPSNFYRPMQKVSNLLDYSIWRLNPFGYHLTNTIIHALNAILIYILINLIFKRKKIAMAVSALFAVHPIHTQAVTYIAGRADLLAGFFIFLSLILFVKYRNNNIETKKYYWGVFLCFILALLSRESAVILPFILILYDISFNTKIRKTKDWLIDYLPFFALLFAYIALRITVLDFSSNVGGLWTSQINLYLRIITFGRVVFTYIRLLLLPFGLHMEYMPNLATTFFQPQIWIANILLLIIFAIIGASYKYSKSFFFCSAWFFLTLLPFSNILPINAVMAEHWLYIPSIGFFIIFLSGAIAPSNFVKNPPLKKSLLIFVIVPVLIFYSVLTILRNKDWKDEFTLYQNVLKYSPGSGRVHNHLGIVYTNMRNYDNAIKEFEEAIKLNPEHNAYNNLGAVYQMQGEYGKAIEQYNKAIGLKPDNTRAYSNLGGVYILLEEYEKAKDVCEKALSLGKNTAGIQNNLAAIYAKQGKYDEAIKHYLKSIEINPDYIDAYKNLGVVYNAQGKYSETVEILEKAVRLSPKNAEIRNELGIAYRYLGEYEKAINEYEKVLKLNPKSFQTYNSLGVIYSIFGEYGKATELYEKSVLINPDFPHPYKNLGRIYLETQNYELAERYLKKSEELGLSAQEELERLEKSRTAVK